MQLKLNSAICSFLLMVCLLANTHLVYGQADDTAQFQLDAKNAYFTAPSYAVRQVNGKSQYLFLARDLKRTSLFSNESAILVLAEHSADGQTRILWQYDLPIGGISVCWWNRNGGSQNAIFVDTYDSTYKIFDATIGVAPHLINSFKFVDRDYVLLGNSMTTFVSLQQLGLTDHIFYSADGLISLNLTNGTTTDIYRLPKYTESSANFLAVRDIDGDGSIDIVGDTGRFVAGNPIHLYPSSFRVWHYLNGKYQQIYQGPPHERVVTGSLMFQYAKKARPAILAQESNFPGLKNAPQETRYALHLYRWNGKQIQELANTVGLLPGQLYNAFVAADLRGDGVQEVVTMFVKGSPRLAVLEYKNRKFVKIWESPDLDYDIEFGRPDHYRPGGEQVPLTAEDTGGKRLFRYASGKFTGWERMVKPLPPPAPPPPPLERRLTWEERDMMDAVKAPKHLLILDGKPLVQVFTNSREINTEYRAQQIMGHIIDLAKQKFPPSKIVARKVGDEDEEPKMEVAGGKIVIITLTESEAKAQGKTLIALADDWASAVRLALITLSKPPK